MADKRQKESQLGDFFRRVSGILKKDARFSEEAYLFVMTALSRVMQGLEKPRHVTGLELLRGIQEEAKEQFGPMAAAVLGHWGVKNSLDFGRIVFNMVQEGILSKTETDALEDFEDVLFFENLFDSVSGYRLEDEPSELKVSGENSDLGQAG